MHAERLPPTPQECLEFIYLVPANSSAALYNPYDLKVVNHKGPLAHNFSTMSAKGVTHHYKGEVRLATKSESTECEVNRREMPATWSCWRSARAKRLGYREFHDMMSQHDQH